MNSTEKHILLPEWPGDFNETMGRFLQEYREQQLRRQRRKAAGVFGLAATSVMCLAAWPLLNSALLGLG